jgi:hexosaminidase
MAVSKKGAYSLLSNKNGIQISANSAEGIFYGIQTLIQLLPVKSSSVKTKISKLVIPSVQINDYPRFSYRGLLLDVGRHFFPVEFIKKCIDYLALHKMNYFHWHLTEDQGWRIEIKKYPNLTQIGSHRKGTVNETVIGKYPWEKSDSTSHGGFYTQQQIKDIVDYASKRFVTIIPEIEMPGHSSAALASYSWLGCTGGPYQVKKEWGAFTDVYCAGNDTVFNFLQDVLDEVIALFPSRYIHIGGDECRKESWKECPKCKKRIKENNLKDEHELQSYFIKRIEKYLNSKGKTIIGWDEILEGGLAPKAIVMSWRGEKGGIEAIKQNHDVIMTPSEYVYFDFSQSKIKDSITQIYSTSVQKLYNYEPIPKEISDGEAKYVLGSQGCVWTEYMKNSKKVEYQVFPRLSALCEVLWSQKNRRDWKDFKNRIKIQIRRYEMWNLNYNINGLYEEY